MRDEKPISESLYQLSDDLERLILEHTDPDTGELAEGAEAAIDAMAGAVREKSVNVALYIKGLRTEAAAVEAMADAIRERASLEDERCEGFIRKAERLEQYLLGVMQRLELKKIEDSRATIKLPAPSKSIEVLAADTVPDEYRLDPRPAPTPGPSKKKLGAAMDRRQVDSLEVDGTVYAQRIYRQRIKID